MGCDGRVEFVVMPVPDMHSLNITNDVPADTAADCARKCHEVCGLRIFFSEIFKFFHFQASDCTLAAFIPTPGHESSGGICLITSDPGSDACDGASARHTPQHASTVPFLIKCIRCSSLLRKKF